MTLLERAESKQPNLLRILTYHQIERPEAFEEQMSYLASSYPVISMADLLNVYETGAKLPPRSVMITFDDAYRNFAECAWPIMKRHNLPVTLFVPTAFPDHAERIFWWDRLRQAFNLTSRRDTLATPLGPLSLATKKQQEKSLKRLEAYVKTLSHEKALVWVEQICQELDAPCLKSNVLGWYDLRQLAAQGVTLGAHSRTHPLLNRVSLQAAEAEIVGSLQDLEKKIGIAPPIFAYPHGQFTEKIVSILRHAGFALAFTTLRGTNDLRHADRLRLRRINIGSRANLSILRARLVHSSAYVNRWRPLPEA
jgi:Predicted xylanase/chitin deacetylase